MVRRSAQRRIFNLRSSNNDQDPWMSSNYAKCTHMFSPRVSLSPVPVELINFPRFCVICRGILARISQEFLSDFCVSAKLTSPSCNSSCLVRPDAMRGVGVRHALHAPVIICFVTITVIFFQRPLLPIEVM